MSSGAALPPTAVEREVIGFRFPDPGHERDGVRLWAHLDLGDDLDLAPVDGGWELRMPHPDVECLEYMFEVDGDLVLDPGNPERVDGAFGEHSWLALPGYAPPSWLELEPVAAERTELTVRRTPVGNVDVTVWSPSPREELPLLVAHDGPEMDRFGRLTHYVGAMVGSGALPPLRVALVSPGDRDKRYSVLPRYAHALVRNVVPAVTRRFPTRGAPVLSGQSLGGLAGLHAAWLHPGFFGGLFLQSGSYFTEDLDPQMSPFANYPAITAWVAGLDAAPRCPVTLTCGTAEENHANNRRMAQRLTELGADVTWAETRQGHTWTCWRDLLDPHLADLLRRVW